MNQVVLLIIAATVLVSYKGFSDHSFFDQYKFQVSRILNGDKIRMLTSGFLHADWLHLGFNMYTLYIFGDILMMKMNFLNFLIIYFGSLLIGSLYSLHAHKKEPYYSAIGASGAVSGIVYSTILLFPTLKFFGGIPAPVFGVGYLLYSIYGMKKQLGNIGHSAHLGGAIGGFVLTIVLFPEIISENKIMVLLLAAPIVGLLLFGNRLKNI